MQAGNEVGGCYKNPPEIQARFCTILRLDRREKRIFLFGSTEVSYRTAGVGADCCFCIASLPDGMHPRHMGCSNRRRVNIINSPIGIHPCMKFHSAFMRFSYHECQRVIIWNGWLTLDPCKPLAPWLQGRGIECICCWSYLHL